MKNVKYIRKAQLRVVQEIVGGETDNIAIYKKLSKERIGLKPKELSGLINKYTEEILQICPELS